MAEYNLPYTGDQTAEYLAKARDFSGEPLDDGLYAGSKTYTAYDQYLNDNGALFKLNPSVSLGYTINISAYPLAKNDPNLIPYASFESASTEAIDEFNNVTAPAAIDEFEANGAQAIADFSGDGSQALADFNTNSDAAIADFNTESSQALTGFSDDSDAALTDFSDESSQALTDFNTDSDAALTGFNTNSSQALTDFSDDSTGQLASQDSTFQNRFAFSQPTLEWTPLTLISDELQLYSTGTVGDSGYSVWLADPALLPFTTSATFAEDEALGRWAASTIAMSTTASVSLTLFGSSGAEGEDITEPLNAAIAAGAKSVYVNQSQVVVSGTVKLAGMAVTGNNTSYSGGFIAGGKLDGITIEGAHAPVSSPNVPFDLAVSRSKTKLLIKEATTANGATTVNDENYSIISSSSYGGIARFCLANGIGGSGSTDLGAPWDRMRVINSFLYNKGFSIMQAHTDIDAGVTDTTIELEPGFTAVWASDGNTNTFAKAVVGGQFIEFTVNPETSLQGNIAFYTSSSSSDQVVVTVNGAEQVIVQPKHVGGGVNNQVRICPITYDRDAPQIVRIQNNAPGAFDYCYVFGVNYFRIGEIPEAIKPSSGFFDKIVLASERLMINTGFGASLDTVLVDSTGKYAGSYHGGDVTATVDFRLASGSASSAKIDITTSVNVPSASDQISVGEVWSAQQIRVRNEGHLQTSPIIDVNMYLDFGIDGGCEVRGLYQANNGDLNVSALFTGMHSTDRSLNSTYTKTFFTGSPTGGFFPMQLTGAPFVQYSSAFAHLAISPLAYSMDNSIRGQHIWDSSSYLKYYYTPIQNSGVTIRDGEALQFACRYQYGEAIV